MAHSNRSASYALAGPANVLVVDDEPEIRRSVRRILDRAGHRSLEASTIAQAELALDNTVIDLVVLDLGLPDGNGLSLIARATKAVRPRGVVVLTGSSDRGHVAASLGAGATSYIHKPIDYVTMEAQVDAALLRVQALRAADEERMNLETSLCDTRALLDELPLKLAAQLCSAWDLRHVETGAHVRRMAMYSEIVALRLGLPAARAASLGKVAMLHDIGKIAIPDAILTKPGRLTAEEFETMKLHTVKGAALLAGVGHPFLELAATVALRHHERWDGSGYPGGLRGEECPYEARIVGVVDVYDALGQARCYKPGWTPEAIAVYFSEQSGKLFEPQIVAALFDASDDLRGIRMALPDPAQETPLRVVSEAASA
jgi:putative two-component system response regulator